ncbi:hypothetical protein PT2222_300050 [Paraburkholderia tropica]
MTFELCAHVRAPGFSGTRSAGSPGGLVGWIGVVDEAKITCVLQLVCVPGPGFGVHD